MAALLFDAPRLVALGLGAGAGATYSYGALFYPSKSVALYNAGVQALSCVYDKGEPTLEALSTVLAQRTIAEQPAPVDPIADTVDPIDCGSSDACSTVTSDYLAAVEGSKVLFKADEAAAAPVQRATNNVIMEVNRQAEALVPDIGRVFEVARGIGKIPDTFVRPKKEEAKPKALPPTPEQEQRNIDTLRRSADAINSAVTLAIAKLETLSTPCPVEVAADAPLTIDASKQKITFTAPGTNEITVTGGTQPLTAKWNGAGPDKDVLDFTYLPPRTIRLVAKKIEGAPYNLLISDSKAAVNVEITMSKP